MAEDLGVQQALVTRLMERPLSETGSFPGHADTRTGATDGNGQSGDQQVWGHSWKVLMASAHPSLQPQEGFKTGTGKDPPMAVAPSSCNKGRKFGWASTAREWN